MRAIGIILAGGNNNKNEELSQKRAIGGNAYRREATGVLILRSATCLIPISRRWAYLTQYNARSLNEHLNSSKWWDFGQKAGRLVCVHSYDYG